jgi:hypothetical protein
MMTTKPLAAALLALALAGAAPAFASFQNPIVSPESAALGGASLTSSHDSASLFGNPAQLAGMMQPDFYFMYDQMYAGLAGVGAIGQGFISGGLPTRYGTFGFGLGMFRAAGLMEERTLALTYARKLTDRLEIGLTGKQLYHSFLIGGDSLAAADPVFAQGHSSSAFGLDLGLRAKVTDAFHVGLVVRNLNEPNVGLAIEDRVPREVQGGLSYDLAKRRLRFTADLTYRDNNAGATQERLTPALGVEKGFQDSRFVFRAGLTPDSFSAGFGLRWGTVGLDYALVLNRNLIAGNVGTHQLGLRVRFGGPKTGARPASATTAGSEPLHGQEPAQPVAASAPMLPEAQLAQPTAAPLTVPKPAGPPAAEDGMR